MFKKILIANRGEIACRIARTCQRLGINAATVHSDADQGALHVREVGESIHIGAAPASESYLNIEAVIAAAMDAGADAVHPGYGFLSENPVFAEAVTAAGISFIGPTPAVLRQFGDKAAAKAAAVAAGVAVVPGSGEASEDPDAILAELRGMTLPVLLKAVGGGGGKGMRVVTNIDAAAADIEAAMREGRNSFADGRLLVEEFLPDARHVEVQILGDGQGKVLHLLERECSLQRRHQKVIEEAPALNLPPALRAQLLDSAVALGRAVDYLGLGTVEFIVKDERAFFLEVNPRLQVEHPVTEMITGLDLIELQILATAGHGIALAQDDITASGHAIEARIYAEDPAQNFMPSTGNIDQLSLPHDGLRIDTGIAAGMAITPYYDPMVAKLIAHGKDRATALTKLVTGLDQFSISGVGDNSTFLRVLLRCAEIQIGAGDTGLIDRRLDELVAEATPKGVRIATAAAIWLGQTRRHGGADIWQGDGWQTGWRLSDGTAAMTVAPILRARIGDDVFDISFGPRDGDGALLIGVGGEGCRMRVEALDDAAFMVTTDGRSRTVRAWQGKDWITLDDGGGNFTARLMPYLDSARQAASAAFGGSVEAPLMGQVLAVQAKVGDTVDKGEVLVVLESMKMEIRVTAPGNGAVTAIHCQVGGNVERGAVIVELDLAP
ncbi:MAG: biotin carboxylase N-terminal domain-containing protein [Alphaproteobacteria bacterium]|mgnify:CR=1 FL=1|jgi:3-methylcrotonyl-CoA carboxylase alpha subunit|nr:carbamoyl-phosphate synthase subunit L [Rhodospirillaceae bacterium]MDP6020083.1 biotin carboxylase N-terminal domain-containing protein [Alphaproteobacteria bacterium]MDP7054084.1 biotin carboxylase N-terminal domain-containing protein [Alphaproteobacteria bacterium]MDP7227395.1 biotin carboxylase N-terminal domain-containing protein [Alphaproteobacteria bacterium]MDP7461515.1 biotin carboxylase N-terminal domain-containing protein [Alphaproteobacteria bacterium]|tara:strand:- start:355 stop:2352 length:1998 start_codon:yes stop_codon:yes gene_type:complete